MGAEHRKTQRRHISQPVLMMHSDGTPIGPCTMLDVSGGGARLKLAGAYDAPSELTLLLSKYDTSMRRRCVVVWRTDAQLGVRFLKD